MTKNNNLLQIQQVLLAVVMTFCMSSLYAFSEADAQAATEEVEKTLTEQGLAELQNSNMIKAIELLTKAHQAEEIDGTAALAEIYHGGAEYEQAAVLYRKCATAGLADCRIRMIRYRELGLGDVEQDFTQALTDLKQMLAEGDQQAKLYYAEVLAEGRLGVEQNQTEAIKLLHELGEANFRPGMLKLSEVYRLGQYGEKVDSEKHRFWKSKATTPSTKLSDY